MDNFVIEPKVNPTQEFIEIANDFTNPLNLVREAISNAFDAGSTEMEILFEVKDIEGERILEIIIRDNGNGMNRDELPNFFDLGNSNRRGKADAIGEKGHGTKVYFNSKKSDRLHFTLS